MNEVYRLRYTNQIVGAFLLVFLILLLVLFFTVFRLGNRFGAKDRYWIETAEADVHELHPGTEVLILGKPVGEVLDLNYLEDGRGVRVDLQLTRQKKRPRFSKTPSFDLSESLAWVHRCW